ncbi:MAG: type II toxin-antitoxin system PemK/MazF family toxin [Bryobacteraceae bacterium]
MKLWPVLVLAGPVGPIPKVLVAYISSVMPLALMPSDLVLDPAEPEFRSTNLKTASVLRLHKLAAVHASMIARHLGTLPESQKTPVAAKLRDSSAPTPLPSSRAAWTQCCTSRSPRRESRW